MKSKFKLMKGLLLTGLMCLSLLSFSQNKYDYGSDSLECRKNISLYDGYMRQKQYHDANRSWIKALEICPKFSESLYKNGGIMYDQFIKENKGNKEREAELIDTMLNVIFKNRVEYFPSANAWGRYGSATLKYNQQDAKSALFRFQQSMELSGDNGANMGTVLGYYQAEYLLYAQSLNKDDKDSTQKLYDLLIDDFLRFSDICDLNMAKNPKWKGVQQSLVSYFLKVVTDCTDIGEVAKKKFESDPENADMMKKMLKLMGKRNCTEEKIYETIAVKYYQLSPSPEAAYNLGVLFSNKNQFGTALTYFKQAVEGCDTCSDINKFILVAAKAALLSKQYEVAVSYAKKILSPLPGDAYFIIGQAIAGSASTCGSSTFDHKAVYWLAMDYMEKAKDHGYSGASTAYSNYAANAPDNNLKFDNGLLGKEGTSIQIDCWGESTTVR